MKTILKQHALKIFLALAVIVIAYVGYNYTQLPVSVKFEPTDKYAPKFALINRDTIGVYIPYIITIKNHRLTKEEFNGVIDSKEKYRWIIGNNDSSMSYDKRGQTKEERRNIRDEKRIWARLMNMPDAVYRAVIRNDYEIPPLCSQEFVFYSLHLYSFEKIKISRKDFKLNEYRVQLDRLDSSLPISIAHLNIDSLYKSDQEKPLTVFLKKPLTACPRYVKMDNMYGENPIYVNYLDSIETRGLTDPEEIVKYLWNVMDTDPVFNPAEKD